MTVGVILVSLIAFLLWGVVSYTANIGKPRQPISPSQAAAVQFVSMLQVSGLLYVLLNR